MHSSNEFQFWSSGGFYKETIYPLITYSSSGSKLIPDPGIISILIFAMILINAGYVLVNLYKEGYTVLKEPVFVSLAVLLLCSFINIIQTLVLKTPNLHGRTALFFYPLTVAAIACFAGIIPMDRHVIFKKIVAALFAFICIFHLID